MTERETANGNDTEATKANKKEKPPANDRESAKEKADDKKERANRTNDSGIP